MEPTQSLGLVPSRRMANMNSPAPGVPRSLDDSAPEYGWEQVVRVVRKRRAQILLLAGGLTALVILVAFLVKDSYRPVARLEVGPAGAGFRGLRGIEGIEELGIADDLETQTQLLRSDALAVSVIRSLRLTEHPEFTAGEGFLGFRLRDAAAPSQVAAIPVEGQRWKEQLLLANLAPSESAALEVFRKRLAVEPVRNSRIIEVTFASSEPALAQLVTNSLVFQFIEQKNRERQASTLSATEWLSSQLGELRQKVVEANQAVADFQRRNGLAEADDADGPLAKLMNELSHQLGVAQAARIEAEAYVRMTDAGQADAVPAIRNDQLYQSLMSRYVDVRSQLVQARAIYGDEHSSVKKLTEQTNELAAQVEKERQRMVDEVRTTFAAASAREQMMLQAREKLKERMGDMSSRLLEFRTLKNEAVANAELYNTLQNRLNEAGLFAGLRSSNIRVVDLASRLTKATSPRRALIIPLGAVLSCVFAFAFAFVQESFDNTIRTPDDIRRWIGLPSLAVLPLFQRNSSPAKPARLLDVSKSKLSGVSVLPSMLPAHSRTAEAEAMRHLLTSVLFSHSCGMPRVIVVSSAAAGEGKSTTAANLAIALSQHGRTCLVEADLRCPVLAASFGLPKSPGLHEVLTGRATLHAAAGRVAAYPALAVIGSGTPPENSADLLIARHTPVVVDALRNEFDSVVIDTPPVMSAPETRYLSSLADAVILVGRYGVTTRRSITRCTELLEEVHAPVAGVVLNGIRLDSPDYLCFNHGYSRRMDRYVRALIALEPPAGNTLSVPSNTELHFRAK